MQMCCEGTLAIFSHLILDSNAYYYYMQAFFALSRHTNEATFLQKGNDLSSSHALAGYSCAPTTFRCALYIDAGESSFAH